MNWESRLHEQYQVKIDTSTWNNNESLAGTDLAGANRRYATWATIFSRQPGGLPKEQLLPRIDIAYRDQLPASMELAEGRFPERQTEALALSKMHWGYYYNLGGGLSTVDLTPAFRPRIRAQTLLRMQMINDVIEAIIGPDKAGTTLLDFACNWGGFAIDMALRGVKHVTAFDFKPDNIDKAKRLADYMGAANAHFDVQNVYDLPVQYRDGFDIVYNLGLFYHVTEPVRLAKITYELTRKVAVFDTIAHKEPFSGFILAHLSEQDFARPGMGELRLEMHPTYRAMIDLILFAGFKNLIEIAAVPGDEYPEAGKELYFQGLRRTIIAFR